MSTSTVERQNGDLGVQLETGRSRIRRFFGSQATYVAVIALFTIVLFPMSRLVNSSLGGWSTVRAVFVISIMLVLVGFGQGLVILVGELDLSIAPVVSLAGVLTVRWMYGLGVAHTVGVILGILALVAVVGLANGIGVTLLKVPSFIMTLGMQLIVAGVTLGYTKGTTTGQTADFLVSAMSARWFGVPVPVFLVVIMAIVGTIIQQYTGFGRRLYAIGSNRATAHIAGVHVRLVVVGAFIGSAICAGLAGMLLAGFSSGATLNMGDPYFLSSIAVVVVGGSSILGGSGTFIGTVVAALFLTTVSTIIQGLGIAQGWQTFIYGAFIVVVIGFLKKDFYVLVGRLFTRRNWGGDQAVSKSGSPAPKETD
jgi:ribose transport system permease protein